jgi:hypothetical protein
MTERDSYSSKKSFARVTSGVWVDPHGEAFAHDQGQFDE